MKKTTISSSILLMGGICSSTLRTELSFVMSTALLHLSFGSDLNAVAVVSTNDVWAVGANLPGGYPFTTLIEHWNGTQWNIVNSPNPGKFNLLGAITASASNFWAVGYYGKSRDHNHMLTELYAWC